MKKNNLTSAQQHMIKLIQDLEGGFIYVKCYSQRQEYYLTRDTGGPIRDSIGLGIKYPQIIKALIRKGVLIPEMDDKEFEIQFALGSIDWRVYNLTEEFDKC